MIVISGALVLVALILLVVGLVSSSLTFVYASIGVSVVSFVALLVGVLQRRKDDQGREATDGVDAAVPVVSEDDAAVAPVRRTASAPAAGGTVLVVAGRPRYHVEGCRYLSGKQPESVDVARAVDEGFTACGVCKPDEALAATSAAADPADVIDLTEVPDEDTTALELPVADEAAAEPSEGAPTRSRTRTTAPVSRAAKAAPAKAAGKAATKATAKATAKAAAKAPAKAPATSPAKAPAKAAKAPAKVAAVSKPATKSADKAPAKAASAAKPAAKAATKAATKAAAAAPKRGGVIVIPDRGKFHKPDCRYVRGVRGALELTRAQAVKQGYDACGVCSS